jgi:hypothetical protein
MNADLLKELVEKLWTKDAMYGVQSKLDKLVQSFEGLVGNPTDANSQQDYITKLTQFSAALKNEDSSFPPHIKDSIRELGGERWFSHSLVEELQSIVQRNAVTSSVALGEIQEISNSRGQYITNLKVLSNSLEVVGVETYEVSHSRAEVGFEIPRTIFDNDFQSFQREMRQLYVIVKTFQKAADEATDPIKLATLSSTDPLVLLAVGLLTLREIAKAVTWSLDTIQRIDQIRQARAATAQIPSIKEKELEKFFGPQIEAVLQEAIKTHKAEVLGAPRAQKHRELGSELESALKMLLTRVERGVRVELRFIDPPPAPENDEDADDPYAEIRGVVADLKSLQQTMQFSKIEHDPILSLTYADESSESDGVGSEPSPTPEEDT